MPRATAMQILLARRNLHEFESEIRAVLIPELGHASLKSQPNRRCSWLSTERTDMEHPDAPAAHGRDTFSAGLPFVDRIAGNDPGALFRRKVLRLIDDGQETLAVPWRLHVDRSTKIFYSPSLPTSKSTGRPRLKRCARRSLRRT